MTWKLSSAGIVALLLLIAPITHAAVAQRARLLPLIIGILFIAAAATSLGVISGNPKTFIVLFLTFWYVVVNDKGATKALDFAGFFSTPAMTVMAMYAGMAIVLAPHKRPAPDCAGRVVMIRGPHGEPMECVCVQGVLATCFEPGP